MRRSASILFIPKWRMRTVTWELAFELFSLVAVIVMGGLSWRLNHLTNAARDEQERLEMQERQRP